jgi:hypothetical protein
VFLPRSLEYGVANECARDVGMVRGGTARLLVECAGANGIGPRDRLQAAH